MFFFLFFFLQINFRLWCLKLFFISGAFVKWCFKPYKPLPALPPPPSSLLNTSHSKLSFLICGLWCLKTCDKMHCSAERASEKWYNMYCKGTDIVSDNTWAFKQCSVWTKEQKNHPKKYSPHHYTSTPYLNRWYKSGGIYVLIFPLNPSLERLSWNQGLSKYCCLSVIRKQLFRTKRLCTVWVEFVKQNSSKHLSH